MNTQDEPVRLSKLMTERGICSRREADRYIERGEVLVDGEVISTLGTKVDPDVCIELKRNAQKRQSEKVTILLNKPLGIVSTQPEKGYRAAIELVTPENQDRKEKGRLLHPSMLHKLSVAGRLDIDSKGLLIFTQDGVLVKKLIGPSSEVEKEYLVRVDGDLTEREVSLLHSGLSLDGKPLKSAKIEVLGPNFFRLVLREGKKRQIRRMCEQVGLKVAKLKRVRVGNICLNDLPEGKWRFLEPGESF